MLMEYRFNRKQIKYTLKQARRIAKRCPNLINSQYDNLIHTIQCIKKLIKDNNKKFFPKGHPDYLSKKRLRQAKLFLDEYRKFVAGWPKPKLEKKRFLKNSSQILLLSDD
jgi:hypothetical protein